MRKRKIDEYEYNGYKFEVYEDKKGEIIVEWYPITPATKLIWKGG